mmetsp:Transcript_18703/g.33813  ORF Transcript_18703/g.33813 Transcript_18703/m.33813 type:complete len:176 (-) Transcript_18703:54-581(-)
MGDYKISKLTQAALLVGDDAEPPQPPVFPRVRPVMQKKDRAGGGRNHIFGGQWRPHRDKEMEEIMARISERQSRFQLSGSSSLVPTRTEDPSEMTSAEIWKHMAPASKRDHVAQMRGRLMTASTGSLPVPVMPGHMHRMETHYQGVFKVTDEKLAHTRAQRGSELWAGRKVCGLL